MGRKGKPKGRSGRGGGRRPQRRRPSVRTIDLAGLDPLVVDAQARALVPEIAPYFPAECLFPGGAFVERLLELRRAGAGPLEVVRTITGELGAQEQARGISMWVGALLEQGVLEKLLDGPLGDAALTFLSAAASCLGEDSGPEHPIWHLVFWLSWERLLPEDLWLHLLSERAGPYLSGSRDRYARALVKGPLAGRLAIGPEQLADACEEQLTLGVVPWLVGDTEDSFALLRLRARLKRRLPQLLLEGELGELGGVWEDLLAAAERDYQPEVLRELEEGLLAELAQEAGPPPLRVLQGGPGAVEPRPGPSEGLGDQERIEVVACLIDLQSLPVRENLLLLATYAREAEELIDYQDAGHPSVRSLLAFVAAPEDPALGKRYATALRNEGEPERALKVERYLAALEAGEWEGS